jgi:hypothetical protein
MVQKENMPTDSPDQPHQLPAIHQIGNAARILAVRLYRHGLEGIADMPGLQKLNRKPRRRQSRVQPLRQRAGFHKRGCGGGERQLSARLTPSSSGLRPASPQVPSLSDTWLRVSASAARAAATASAPGFGRNRAGSAMSTGATSLGATITRMPSLSRCRRCRRAPVEWAYLFPYPADVITLRAA